MMMRLFWILPLLIPVVCEAFLDMALPHHGFLRPLRVRNKASRPLFATSSDNNSKLSEADKERLLLSEPALNAFIVAEMRHFVTEAMETYDMPGYKSSKWQMKHSEKVALGLVDDDGTVLHEDYTTDMDGALAVELICNATHMAFTDGFQQQGLLSALGSAICFFRSYFREPRLLAACERVGLSDYTVTHHITDMYHHRTFRGAYTKTLTPSGKGEIAARVAVGLPPLPNKRREGNNDNDQQQPQQQQQQQEEGMDEEDECLVWSPTTPGVCLHWKSDDEAFHRRRFEKIQMEGTRDPRRGGSGTTR